MNNEEKILAMLENMQGSIDTMSERLDAMDKRFDTVDNRLDVMDKRFDTIDKRLDSVDKRFDTMINDVTGIIEMSTMQINLKIENEVVKHIDTLFDGYKLVHEKQWELEQDNKSMARKIDELFARITALESKVS